MHVITPGQVARVTPDSNKYEGIMVAAAYARKLNELPKEGGKEWRKKYTTRSLEELVQGELAYSVIEKRPQ